MKWMLLILFTLPHLAIGQAGQTEDRNKVQTAWCEFSGLVALVPFGDSSNPQSKILLGTTRIEYGKITWFDSIIITGKATFSNLPTYTADITEPNQDLLVATADSLYLIALDQPFSTLTPNIVVQRYPIPNVTDGTTLPEEYAFTISRTDSGSTISKLLKEYLVPIKEIHVSDSILFLTSLSNVSSFIETIHHRDSSYMAIRWSSNLEPVDTLFIPDSLGHIINPVRFFDPYSNPRILIEKDSLYSLIVYDSWHSIIDTILQHINKPNIEPRTGYNYFYYIDTVYNDTTYITTIPGWGGLAASYVLPGHATMIQTIIIDFGYEYSFLWVDSTTNHIFGYMEDYGQLDTLGTLTSAAIAIGAIHFCWGGVEVGDPDITPTIYPNPAKDVVYFRPAALRHPQKYHIEIFNGQGQLLNASVKPGDETVELSLKGIPYGLLLIRITGGELSETFKILHQIANSNHPNIPTAFSKPATNRSTSSLVL